MDINNNLLALTVRRNHKQNNIKNNNQNNNNVVEEQAVIINCPGCAGWEYVYEEPAEETHVAPTESDSIEFRGKAIDLLGTLTDEQIEAIYKVGYEKAVQDMIEIITTCKDITDKELIEIFLGRQNPTGVPEKLRIIRESYSPNGDSDSDGDSDDDAPEDPPGEAPDISGIDDSATPDDTEFNTAAPEWEVKRKAAASSRTINSGDDITLKISNQDAADNDVFPEMYYKIEPNDGASSCNVKVEYLANGRVVISGDNIKITCKAGQNDNLIIMGSNNYIDTNTGDDTVRVGMVRDSANSRNYYENSANNIILTGDGNDYVESRGYNSVNMGDGNGDRIFTDLGSSFSGTTHTAFKGAEESIEVTGSKGGGYPKAGTTSKNSENTSDGHYTWSMQNGFGDCQTLSTFNSLFASGHAQLSDYIEINPDGDGKWNVLFKKSNITQVVESSDITGGSAMGDKDMQILETACRLYMKKTYGTSFENKSSGNIMGASNNYNNLSKLLFNVDTGTTIGTTQYALTDEQYRWFVEQYVSGGITQVSFACNDPENINNTKTNDELGIYSGHAYALIGGEAGKYADLVNPWDSNDVIRLSWEDFKYYFRMVLLFADTYTKFDSQYGVARITSPGSDSGLQPSSSSDGSDNNEPKVVYICDNTSDENESEQIEAQIENIQSVLKTAPKKLHFMS